MQANESLINYAPVAANSEKMFVRNCFTCFSSPVDFFLNDSIMRKLAGETFANMKKKTTTAKERKKVKMSVSGSETSRRAMEEEEKLVSGNR